MPHQTNKPGCTLSILVARPDVGYMMHTIPHIVKMCAYPFTERVLVLDPAPLDRRYESTPAVGSAEELRERCRALIETRVMDRIWEIDYSGAFRTSTYSRHLDTTLFETRDWRGCPNLGRMGAIDAVSTQYFLHFDADMLIFQDPGHDWISDGMELLDKADDVMFVAPLAGPPASDGILRQRGVHYSVDPRGFYRFSTFTSRKYLLDRRKLERILPLERALLPWKRRWLNRLTGKSGAMSWEIMVSNRLQHTPYIRADLSSRNCWTLHTPDHGTSFIKALPKVIGKVEQGWYPASQGGDYDLRLDAWL